MKKISRMILPVLFIGFLTVVAAITLFDDSNVYSENEKRYLTPFPEFTWENIKSGNFAEELETYMSDHLWGRDFYVGVDAYYSKTMGKNALRDIYSTDDGYLINAPKEQDKSDPVNHYEKNLSNFESFTVFNGIKSTLIIVPSSGYIMEDKLPDFHKEYNDGELIVKASEATPSVRFLDAREPLMEAYAKGKQVYYKTDHHLTSQGSYELYKAYCKLNGMEYPEVGEYTITTHGDFYGTTYSGSGYWLTKPDNLEIWDLGESVTVTVVEGDESEVCNSMFFKEHLGQMDKYPVYLDGNHSYVKIENPNAKGGKLLVIRDSFGQNFVPFLAHNYKEIYMLDMRYYRNPISLITENAKIDEVLYIYGIDTLLTDSSSSYLFF